MIRQAGLEDVPAILEWGERFHAYSPWGKRTQYDPESTRKTVEYLIKAPEGAIFITEAGVCGGLIFPLYFNHAYRIAQELFWFAPGDGTDLRQAFEEWAREQGASAIQMSCLADKRESAMRRLLSRHGYRATETSLIREIA